MEPQFFRPHQFAFMETVASGRDLVLKVTGTKGVKKFTQEINARCDDWTPENTMALCKNVRKLCEFRSPGVVPIDGLVVPVGEAKFKIVENAFPGQCFKDALQQLKQDKNETLIIAFAIADIWESLRKCGIFPILQLEQFYLTEWKGHKYPVLTNFYQHYFEGDDVKEEESWQSLVDVLLKIYDEEVLAHEINEKEPSERLVAVLRKVYESKDPGKRDVRALLFTLVYAGAKELLGPYVEYKKETMPAEEVELSLLQSMSLNLTALTKTNDGWYWAEGDQWFVGEEVGEELVSSEGGMETLLEKLLKFVSSHKNVCAELSRIAKVDDKYILLFSRSEHSVDECVDASNSVLHDDGVSMILLGIAWAMNEVSASEFAMMLRSESLWLNTKWQPKLVIGNFHKNDPQSVEELTRRNVEFYGLFALRLLFHQSEDSFRNCDRQHFVKLNEAREPPVDDRLLDLLVQCLAEPPKERPSFRDIQQKLQMIFRVEEDRNDISRYGSTVRATNDSGPACEAIAISQNRSFRAPSAYCFLQDSISDTTEEAVGDFAFFGARVSGITLAAHKIGALAFGYCRGVGEWNFTEPITALSYGSFACSSLKKLTCGDGLVVIPNECFSRSSLEEICFADSVEEIGSAAFEYCPVKSVILPKRLKYIRDRAWFKSQLEHVDSRDCSGLVEIGDRAFAETRLREFDLPQETTDIGAGAFAASSLTNFKTERNTVLRKIGNEAFMNTQLVTFHLPEGTRVIGDRAFLTKSLKGFNTKRNTVLEEIGDEAFRDTCLTEFNLPARTRIIGAKALATSTLAKFHTDQNYCLEEIGDDAFQGTGIGAFFAPRVLRSIGKRAFARSKIKSFDTSACAFLEIVDESAFSQTLMETFTLPGCCGHIADNAFGEQRTATNVLTELTISEGPRKLQISDFGESTPNNLSVPVLTRDQYVTAPEWLRENTDWTIHGKRALDLLKQAAKSLKPGEAITPLDGWGGEPGAEGMNIGDIFSDAYRRSLLVMNIRPTMPEKLLSLSRLQLQTCGYLFDYQFGRLNGLHAESTILSLTYMYQPPERSEEPNCVVFDTIVDVFAEAAFQVENTVDQLMTIGLLVSNGWLRFMSHEKDRHFQATLHMYFKEWKIRRCKNLDKVEQLKQQYYDTVDEHTKRMIELGLLEVKFIKFLQNFQVELGTLTEPGKILCELQDLFDTDIPEIDVELEAQQMARLTCPEVTNEDGCPVQLIPMMNALLGFQREHMLKYGGALAYLHDKPLHKNATQGWKQIWSDLKHVVQDCADYSELYSLQEKQRPRVGCAFTMRWGVHMNCVYREMIAFTRYLAAMFFIPHNQFHDAETEPAHGNCYVMMIGRQIQLWDLVSNDMSNYTTLPTPLSGRFEGINGITMFYMYGMRMMTALPQSRGFESLEDLLLAQIETFMTKLIEAKHVRFVIPTLLHWMLLHIGLGMSCGVFSEPKSIVFALSFAGAMFAYLSFLHTETPPKQVRDPEDPFIGSNSDFFVRLFPLLAKALTASARLIVEKLNLKTTWDEIASFAGFEMMIRLNRRMRTVCKVVLQLRSKYYYFLWTGLCFPDLAQTVKDNPHKIGMNDWVDHTMTPDEIKQLESVFATLADELPKPLHTMLQHFKHDFDQFCGWYESAYEGKLPESIATFRNATFPVPQPNLQH